MLSRRSILTGLASCFAVLGIGARPQVLSPETVEATIQAVLTGAPIFPWEMYATEYPELYPRWKEACIIRSTTFWGLTREQAERAFASDWFQFHAPEKPSPYGAILDLTG